MSEIPQAAIDAAHAHDLAGRPRGESWSRPPDDQLRRLLEGAAPHMRSDWERIADALRDDNTELRERLAQTEGPGHD